MTLEGIGEIVGVPPVSSWSCHMAEEHTKTDFVDELRTLLSDGNEEALQVFLRLVRPEDIAEYLDVLSIDDRQRIVGVLDANVAGTVLTDTTSQIRSRLVGEIGPKRLARIAEALPPDEAADLIGELDAGETEEVFHHIPSAEEEVLRPPSSIPASIPW